MTGVQTCALPISNKLNDRYIAYLWAEIPGFSKFGSLTGNLSTDGPAVITGFRPRWILIKKINAGSTGGGTTSDWWIWDTTRNTYNVMNSVLYANLSDAEYSDSSTFLLDVLSNGFKVRNSNATVNANGHNYIYCAWAEAPTINLYGAQANAR